MEVLHIQRRLMPWLVRSRMPKCIAGVKRSVLSVAKVGGGIVSPLVGFSLSLELTEETWSP